jgi:hypothetical protein
MFKINSCQKMINYQGVSWKVSASVDAAKTVTVDLKELSKEVQQITTATNHAKLLDDYQVLFWQDMKRWADDANYVRILRSYRIIAIAYITRLAEILQQIEKDKTNKSLKRELARVSRRMSRVTEKFENAVLRDAQYDIKRQKNQGR